MSLHPDLIELYAKTAKSAWHYARQAIKDARDFKDPGFRRYFVKKAMWHRDHAKQLRAALKAA